MSRVILKQVLGSLSLSYQKKAWPAQKDLPSPAKLSFGMTPTVELYSVFTDHVL